MANRATMSTIRSCYKKLKGPELEGLILKKIATLITTGRLEEELYLITNSNKYKFSTEFALPINAKLGERELLIGGIYCVHSKNGLEGFESNELINFDRSLTQYDFETLESFSSPYSPHHILYFQGHRDWYQLVPRDPFSLYVPVLKQVINPSAIQRALRALSTQAAPAQEYKNEELIANQPEYPELEEED